MAAAVDVKPLLRIQGLTLLERSIANAMRAGVTEFVIVTGYEAQRVEKLAVEISRRRRVSISVVYNADWRRGNASSVLAAQAVVDEPFLLLMGDHILDERILLRLLEHGLARRDLRSDALVLAVDRSDPAESGVDVLDATRVALRGQRIERIGKGLERYDAFDTGAFLCSPRVFQAVEEALGAGEGSLSAAVQRLATSGRASVLDVTGLPWLDVDTPADAARASTRLGRAGKSADGWVSRVLNRPLSTRVTTPLLLRLIPSVTANQVSALSALLGVAAAVCFALHWPWAAALLVHAASVLDGSDGEVARLKRLESPFGGFLDAMLDRYADSLIMLALAYFALTSGGLSGAPGWAAEPLVLVVSAFAVSGTWLVSYSTARANTDLGHQYGGAWMGGGRGRDLRLLIVAITGLAATVQPLAAVAGLAAIAVLTHVIVVQRIRRSWSQVTGRTELARIEAIIYDLDGTLIDSMPALTERATALIQRHYGLEHDDACRRYTATTGADFATQLEEMVPAHPSNPLVATEFEAAKEELISRVQPFPDAQWAVAYFAAQGVRQFVCSSTRTELACTALQSAGFAAALEGFTGYRAHFDKERQLQHLIDTYGLRSETTLFVGDSLRDAAFARRAHTRFLGVTRMFADAEFRRSGADTVSDLRVLARRWAAATRVVSSFTSVPSPAVEPLDTVPRRGGDLPG